MYFNVLFRELIRYLLLILFWWRVIFFYLFDLVEFLLKFWSSLNSFCKLDFRLEKSCLREEWFQILVGMFVLWLSTLLRWFVISSSLVSLSCLSDIESFSGWRGRSLSLMTLWIFVGKSEVNSCTFSEWLQNPIIYLHL